MNTPLHAVGMGKAGGPADKPRNKGKQSSAFFEGIRNRLSNMDYSGEKLAHLKDESARWAETNAELWDDVKTMAAVAAKEHRIFSVVYLLRVANAKRSGGDPLDEAFSTETNYQCAKYWVLLHLSDLLADEVPEARKLILKDPEPSPHEWELADEWRRCGGGVA